MTVILMTQETGSRGDEVATGIAECLGVELVNRDRLERCIAQRIQIDEATVQRIFKDKASLLERWMIDRRRLSRCMGEEVVRLAARGDVLIQTCRVTPLLRLIKHAICLHVCATARSRAAAFLKRPGVIDGAAARDEISQGDATPSRTRRWLFGSEWESPGYFDLILNTERVPVAECVEQVRQLAQSPEFQPTAASQAALANLLQETRQESIPNTVLELEPARIADVVVVNSSHVILAGVTNNEEAIARIEEHLRGEKQLTTSRPCSLPPAGLLD